MSTIEYSYDKSDHLLSEIRHPNDNLYTYVWRDDIPVAVIIHPTAQQLANPTQAISNADQIIYLETDHLNTPRIGRDQSAKKVWEWQSDAFGATLANPDPDQNNSQVIINLRFPGQQFDLESGLHYNHHRYYDPLLGRYTNSDPSGLAGGLNSFAYANANSLRYADPTGEIVFAPAVYYGALGLATVGAAWRAANHPAIPNGSSSSSDPFANSGTGSSSSSSSSSSSASDSKSACDPDKNICDKQYQFDQNKCYERYGNGLRGSGFTSNLNGCLAWASQRWIACYKKQPDPGPYPGYRGDNVHKVDETTIILEK